MYPKLQISDTNALWPCFLSLISLILHTTHWWHSVHFVSKACRQTIIKVNTRLGTKLQLLTQMAQVKQTKQNGKTGGERGQKMERFNEWGAEFELSESNISAGKNWGVGTINQSVHLVGSHMADQHANSANLLMFSNGVQLIPLAAFISPSNTERRQVEK